MTIADDDVFNKEINRFADEVQMRSTWRDEMQDPKVQFGTSHNADFDDLTWTFTMDGGYGVQAGRHAILTENEYQRLLEAAKENLRLQEVAKENVQLRQEKEQLSDALIACSLRLVETI